MSEMIERVARAIYADFGVLTGSGKPAQFDDIDIANRDRYFRWARAVIAAMREPTEAMIDASARGDIKDNEYERGFLRNEWRFMIDEAIKP